MTNLNVTRHARERWQQRVNPITTNNLEIEDQIRAALSQAEYIGDDPDNNGNSFYMNSDHWVFCVDPKKQNIVTVFEVDFGFSSPKLNKQIANDLLKDIRKIRADIEKTKSRNETELLKLQQTCESITSEIELKEKELQKAESQINTLKIEEELKQKEFNNIFKELIYSIAFKKEQLVLKNGV